jgi:hypothetical protein
LSESETVLYTGWCEQTITLRSWSEATVRFSQSNDAVEIRPAGLACSAERKTQATLPSSTT